MKNESRIDTSKTHAKISSSHDDPPHDQFFHHQAINQKPLNGFKAANFENRNPSESNSDDDQRNKAYRGKPFEASRTNVLPRLARIGSDEQSSDSSLDKQSSSTFRRKPVGNLTPTKFEYLQSSSSNQQELSKPNAKQHTDLFNNHHHTNPLFDRSSPAALNELTKEQSHSLNSIESTNLSVQSVRSSADLVTNHVNQRSHTCPTSPYFNNTKPAFGHFKTAYSSSNLFDSIQHLDIQKLIQNDKRSQFCLTSTLPTCTSTATTSSNHSVLVPKNAKTSAFITASSIYGQLLIVICLCLFTAEIRTTLPLHYFEGFFFYLYSVSIVFLIYVFVYLLRGVKSSELRSRELKFKKNKVSGNEKSFGSIFLRVGCIAFGLGSMVYNGLEFGSYFEFGKLSPCHSIYLALNPLLQAIFTFCQMYFIFTYSRLMINKFKLIARVGLFHLVATNICTWIKILLKESLQTLHFNESASSHATLEELILPLKIAIKHANNTTSFAFGHQPLNASNPCMKENIMGTILADISPYLYPFIVEYSLIGAAFLYVMWCNIGRLSHTIGSCKSSAALSNQHHLHHHANRHTNCPHVSGGQKQDSTVAAEPHQRSRSGSISPSLSANHLDNNVVLFNTATNQMETNLSNPIETNSSSASPTNQTTNTSITPTSSGNANLISTIQCTPPTNRNVLLINTTHQLNNSNYAQSNANAPAGNTSNALLLDNLSTGSSRDSFNGGKYTGHLSYQVNSMYTNNMQSTQSLYSCLGNSKGLFCGFLFLVISIITLIIFFVLFHHTNYHLIASLINEGSHSVLLVLSSFSIIVAYFKIRKLKFQPGVNDTADSGLRDILLKVSAFGLFNYSLFGLIAGALNASSVQSLAVLITSILSIVQVSLQSLFISDIVCRKRCNARQPVPQQIMTFFMITNFIFWILYTFEMQKVEASPVQLKIYGQLTWSLIIRCTLPLSIFYRFHSFITFGEEIIRLSHKNKSIVHH